MLVTVFSDSYFVGGLNLWARRATRTKAGPRFSAGFGSAADLAWKAGQNGAGYCGR